jgi:anti-sigma regulatory factor (Ser/Thr protein kinase)
MTTPPLLVREVTVPGLPEYVHQVRTLARMASSTPCQAEAAALCASELITNAIVHSRSGQPGGTVTVTIEPGQLPGDLRISVRDDGASRYELESWLAPPAVDGPVVPEHGYGMAIVDAVAVDWGRSAGPGPGSWTTWCEIPSGDET